VGEFDQKSVSRDHRSRVEPVIELEQYFVGLEILVTGGGRIEASNRYCCSGGKSANGSNRTETETFSAVLRVAILNPEIPIGGEGIGRTNADGEPEQRLGIESRRSRERHLTHCRRYEVRAHPDVGQCQAAGRVNQPFVEGTADDAPERRLPAGAVVKGITGDQYRASRARCPLKHRPVQVGPVEVTLNAPDPMRCGLPSATDLAANRTRICIQPIEVDVVSSECSVAETRDDRDASRRIDALVEPAPFPADVSADLAAGPVVDHDWRWQRRLDGHVRRRGCTDPAEDQRDGRREN
jgi:hypothetical protein